MGLRLHFVLLFVMVIGFINANARSLVTSDTEVISLATEVSTKMSMNGEVCKLCQEFTAQAVHYLSENVTQGEIIGLLHLGCSSLASFKHECLLLVDFYAPILFKKISTVKPNEFCEQVDLCDETISVPLPKRDEACTLCHRVVGDILIKLQDPETQLDLIQVLLKGCNRVENFVQECKKLVFQYGPLILANAEKVLETTELCDSMHMCSGGQEAAFLKKLLISAD